MNRIGISFKSPLLPDEVLTQFIQPLRHAIEAEHAGVYSNYLRQVDPSHDTPDEHLIVFLVRDFQAGLRLLRLELQQLGVPSGATFHNLDPSEPMY
jgi:hypothetical protein